MFGLIWLVSIVGTIIVADQKNRSTIGFFFLSLVLGPVAFIVVMLIPAQPKNSLVTPYKIVPSQNQAITPENAGRQLQEIRHTLQLLQGRIDQIEQTLDGKSMQASAQTPIPVIEASNIGVEQTQTVVSEENKPEALEFIFAKYWLNRIGVVLFVIGIGLFISYTFQYFSAWMKIAIGYFFAAMFLLWGNRLEKNPKLIKLAWGIIGGGWGLLYLTAYAMYYIPATKIITNSYVELAFLWAVSIGVVKFNLKYKSWVVTAMSYLLGFITMGLAGVDHFSIVFWALLLGSFAYLAHALRWRELLLTGIVGSYLMYIGNLRWQLFPSGYWHASPESCLTGLQFLTVAWVLFTLTLLYQKTAQGESGRYVVSGFLINTAMYATLGLTEVRGLSSHSLGDQFVFLLILASIHLAAALYFRITEQSRHIVTHGIIAISLCSFAVLIRYPQLSVSFWWALEMMLVFGLGVYYKEYPYRVMGCILSAWVMLRFFCFDLSSHQVYQIGQWSIAHNVLAGIVAAAAYLILGRFFDFPKVKELLREEERDLYFYFFPVAGALVLVSFISDQAPQRWLTLQWTLLGLAFLMFGFWIKHRVYRLSALGILTLALGHIIVYDLSGVNTIYRIVVVIFLGAALLGTSMIYSRVKQ